MKVEGKVAVVVGAARGIGKAYCEALLERGAKGVVVADILVDEGTATVKEFHKKFGQDRAVFIKCDNRKDEDIKNVFSVAVEMFGRPDIAIHNAATIHEFEWENCIDVNVGGCIRLTNEALKYMSKANGGTGGAIVHTGSIGSLGPHDWGPVYIATKYAILGYTLSWALPANLETTGVRFNCVCPTAVDTEFAKFVRPDRTMNSEDKQKLIATVKKVSPEFVAEGMIKLVEDDSLCGKALRVSVENGLDFAPMPDQPLE